MEVLLIKRCRKPPELEKQRNIKKEYNKIQANN